MTKIDYMLEQLLKRSLNTFQAQMLGDTCLNTTVSQLRRDPTYKADIKDKWETIETRWGTKTQVKRYWIDSEERLRIQQIRNKSEEVIKAHKQKKRSAN